MKLSTKITFFVTIFFSVIFLLGGYTLISSYYEISMKREVETATQQYQYNKFVLQSTLITRGDEWFDGVVHGIGKESVVATDKAGSEGIVVSDATGQLSRLASDMTGTVAFYGLDGTRVYSEFPVELEVSEFLSALDTGEITYRFENINNRMHMLLAGKVQQKDTGLYLVTGMEVERILEQQEEMIQKFGMIYGVSIGTGILLIILLSFILTRPIKQLTEAAKEIAEGNYEKRIHFVGEDEVGQLAGNFNRMAEAIEEKVQELSENARQKEDFVANFAHELKTPLTSIIGYADRIYQKELSGEEQKKAAWYIWNEGMRLEALAHKLMDLTVLNHKDFLLEEMKADTMLAELAGSEEYLLTEKGVALICEAEEAYIYVEYDLFQSLLLNLMDNAIKAGANRLWLKGYLDREGGYVIQLTDNGRGIPKKELARITEAFYMVDKSRSRKLHGAGLGLALAEKIAGIHGSSLEFESDGEHGTTVRLCLKCEVYSG